MGADLEQGPLALAKQGAEHRLKEDGLAQVAVPRGSARADQVRSVSSPVTVE